VSGFRILGGGSLASSLDLRCTRKSALRPPGIHSLRSRHSRDAASAPPSLPSLAVPQRVRLCRAPRRKRRIDPLGARPLRQRTPGGRPPTAPSFGCSAGNRGPSGDAGGSTRRPVERGDNCVERNGSERSHGRERSLRGPLREPGSPVTGMGSAEQQAEGGHSHGGHSRIEFYVEECPRPARHLWGAGDPPRSDPEEFLPHLPLLQVDPVESEPLERDHQGPGPPGHDHLGSPPLVHLVHVFVAAEQ